MPEHPGPMSALQLRTTLQPKGPAAAVILTDAQVCELGGGKTPAVRVSVNGKTFDGRIGRMGGENLIGFTKQTRALLGVAAGDTVDVQIALDASVRVVDVPPALAQALAEDTEADTRFKALAPSHRKEFARWVAEAKRDETRQRRVAEALTMIRDGHTRG